MKYYTLLSVVILELIFWGGLAYIASHFIYKFW